MSRQQKSIYVPEYMNDIFDAAMDSAIQKNIGLGYVLLAAWAKEQKIPVPEYKSKGQITRERERKKSGKK